jgi:hypothetical protein
MQAVTEVFIGLSGEETEGRVRRPIEPDLIVASIDQRTPEPYGLGNPLNLVAFLLE